jgi:DNA-binding beta-propeller fold protein YncE
MAIGAIGSHRLEYEVVEGWERLPEGWAFTEVVGVAVDSRERVFVFCRGPQPLIIFDKDGRFLDAWGAGRFVRPHGIFISSDDRVFLTDDEGHTVHEFAPDGTFRRRLGDGRPSDTGFVAWQSPVTRAAGPFNTVTNVTLAPDGEIYAADGYGNARVHRFAADGRLLASWGEPGSGPGQFNLPHGIAVDRGGRVYVADRENSRIQIFSRDGALREIWDWVNRPCDLFIDAEERIYVAELGFLVGNEPVPHLRLMQAPPAGHSPIARVSICTPDGTLIGRVGGTDSVLPGNFFAPHGLCVSPRGDLYVGEVVAATGVVRRLAPLTPHCLQKFVRRSG